MIIRQSKDDPGSVHRDDPYSVYKGAPASVYGNSPDPVERTQPISREQELEDTIRAGRKKAVFVVRARQERTGILYTDARLLKSPEDVLRAFGRLFERAAVEQMLAVSLTKRGEPVAVRLVAVGGVDACMVSVAEVMKFVLLSNCPDVLLLHNHPSGNAVPSGEDRAITERVEQAANLIGLTLIDHIIVGDRQNGYSIKYDKAIQLPVD